MTQFQEFLLIALLLLPTSWMEQIKNLSYHIWLRFLKNLESWWPMVFQFKKKTQSLLLLQQVLLSRKTLILILVNPLTCYLNALMKTTNPNIDNSELKLLKQLLWSPELFQMMFLDHMLIKSFKLWFTFNNQTWMPKIHKDHIFYLHGKEFAWKWKKISLHTLPKSFQEFYKWPHWMPKWESKESQTAMKPNSMMF